ncbi:cysteine hydrolase [Pediococcus stilesii]|uniref:Cysteine hydrolase n=1 Tax=Pediococcus stilesii TaxID=331679 RepID=A0A5R9BTN8_9LACO|nr:cysteine hydrolase family protein [Pediococcus stilesii]TLQ04024.1 cysteine hydrolase [Pediococcus stilesii]
MISDVLLVIDLQNGVCHSKRDIDHLSELVENTNNIIQSYRIARRPIIFIRHHEEGLEQGSSAWQLLPEIDQQPTDIFLGKTHANSFFHTNLMSTLKEINAKSIEICGAQTEYCIDATVKFAHGLGFQVQMKKGATSTYDNSYMTASQTISFFEMIWKDRYLKLY